MVVLVAEVEGRAAVDLPYRVEADLDFVAPSAARPHLGTGDVPQDVLVHQGRSELRGLDEPADGLDPAASFLVNAHAMQSSLPAPSSRIGFPSAVVKGLAIGRIPRRAPVPARVLDSGRTGRVISDPETGARHEEESRQLDNIACIEESTTETRRVYRIDDFCKGRVTVFAGDLGLAA